MNVTKLPIPLKITGPDGRRYTTYTAKHYEAFERGMEARKAGKAETSCPYRSELAEFWLAGFNSPTLQPGCSE
jgi:hypothetical protein